MEIEFIAVSGEYVPQHDGAMDVATLRIPVNGGEKKVISEISDSDRVNLPLLVDHDPAVKSQAGTIEAVWVDEAGAMRVRASLNDTDAGRLVEQLYEAGDLKNSFSIGWIPESPEPDSDHVWRNAELVEISVVYAGADAGAVIPSARVVHSALSDVDICYFNQHEEERAAQNMAENRESAAIEFGEEEISAIANAVASKLSESGNDGETEETETEGEAPVAEESKATEKMESAARIPERPAFRVKTRTSWLDSIDAMRSFADVMMSNPGSSARGLRMRWSEAAASKLSDNDSPYTVVPGDIPLPTQIASTIYDALNVAGIGLYSRLNHTGVKDPLTILIADDEQDSDSVRAHGYTAATTGDSPTEKTLEKIATSTKTISPDVVYKYVRLNRGDLLGSRNPDTLLNYVLSEMPNRVVQTIESRILGSSLDDISMYEQVTEGTEVALADTAISTLANLVDEVDGSDSQKVLCISTDFKSVLNSELVTGSTTMIGYSDLPSFLGVSAVLKIPSQYSVPIYAAVINTDDYILVGDTSTDAFENFSLAQNAQEFLCELYQGGGARTTSAMAYVNGETETTES